jgi:hypothetical protein
MKLVAQSEGRKTTQKLATSENLDGDGRIKIEQILEERYVIL